MNSRNGESEVNVNRWDKPNPLNTGLILHPDGRWVLYADYEQALAEKDREIAKWKAAHAEMVSRNKLLRDRPDLPADRIQAHDEWVEKYQQLMEKAVGLAETVLQGHRHRLKTLRIVRASASIVLADTLMQSPEVQAWKEKE